MRRVERWSGTHSEVDIVVLNTATELLNEIADLEAVVARNSGRCGVFQEEK